MERKERRHHTREFKLEAVRLAAIGDKTKAKVARELGVRVNQLRQWRLDFDSASATYPGPGSPANLPISGTSFGIGSSFYPTLGALHSDYPFGTYTVTA